MSVHHSNPWALFSIWQKIAPEVSYISDDCDLIGLLLMTSTVARLPDSWVPRNSEPRMTVLWRTSRKLPDSTGLLLICIVPVKHRFVCLHQMKRNSGMPLNRSTRFRFYIRVLKTGVHLVSRLGRCRSTVLQSGWRCRNALIHGTWVVWGSQHCVRLYLVFGLCWLTGWDASEFEPRRMMWRGG
jgi:hypothetical protein